MSRVCQVTGKRPMVGNNVSHSNRKTKRRFLPNIKIHRIWVPDKKCFIKLKLSSHGLRIIQKQGIEQTLKKLHSVKNS